MNRIDDDIEGEAMLDPKARMKRLCTKPLSPETSFHNDNSLVDIEVVSTAGSFHLTLEDDHGTRGKDMDPKLYKAAARDDANGFMDVLEQISNEKQLPVSEIFRTVSLSGNSLLHVAVRHENTNIMKLIIDHFPSLLEMRNFQGDTAMHIAAKAGKKSAINQLQKAMTGSFPSTKYCELANKEVVLEDVSLRVTNQVGNTPLHEALIKCDPLVAEQLVQADWEVSYFLNNDNKSPLYLAAEAGYIGCLVHMLEDAKERNIFERVKGKSPVHVAIMRGQKDALVTLLDKEPRFIHKKDEEGGNSLHFAASIGYLKGVRYLINKCNLIALKRDKSGKLPIHVASMKGHIDVIKELLKQYYDPCELHDRDGRNILHIAAESGRYNVVRYVLQTPDLENLINEKDKAGNTPLLLASMKSHPKIVSAMTWDKRVDLNVINHGGLTALDAALDAEKITIQERLTWSSLRAAGAVSASYVNNFNARIQAIMLKKPLNNEIYREKINTLLLVSTLVATVTFAAGFTMPGGYNSSDPSQGMATLLRHHTFQIFVFCDTIAMYSSLVVTLALIWTQLSGAGYPLKLVVPILGLALTMMSVAFMAGVYLVVNKVHWLAYSVLVVGLLFLVAVATFFLPLIFPMTSSFRVLRYITFYVICFVSLITKRLL